MASSSEIVVAAVSSDSKFKKGLGLFDSTMVVVGIMIGSGIFIVSAEMARLLGSTGWLLVAWILTGALTIAGALSYGELAAMMPRAGGQYIYLREAFSPLWGFLYGWTLFAVIQTGTIAAVSVAFARFLGVLWPWVSEENYLVAPIRLSSGYAVSFSTAQLVGISVIILLTWVNRQGLDYGKLIQNMFTIAKVGILLGVIAVGLLFGWNPQAVEGNFGNLWSPRGYEPIVPGLDVSTVTGLLVAICVSQTGSLFAADAWHSIAFAAEEVKNPQRNVALSMALGALIVICLYLLTNVAYLVTLPLAAIQHAPADRVGTAVLEAVLPRAGTSIMAAAIMISTFGAINALILSGARAYYAMASDRLFFRSAGILSKARVPAWALAVQGIWAAALVLPRTFNSATGKYGNLYSNLLDYVISAALVFYILTIAGIFVLRVRWRKIERPYRAFGYPVVPALYILGAAAILLCLFAYRSSTTWPGLAIVLFGLPVYFLFRALGRKQ
jgi:APA family basic amino acid/polyamine antiporter